MTRRYRYTTSLSRGGDEPTWEGEVTVSYAVTPGDPETGPTYACGGTPATDATIDEIKLETVDGKARPWGMYSGYIPNEDDEFEREVVEELEGSDRHIAEMLAEASGQDAADADRADDLRREE